MCEVHVDNKTPPLTPCLPYAVRAPRRFFVRVGVAGEAGSDDTTAAREKRSGGGDGGGSGGGGGGGGSDGGGGARVLNSMSRVGCAAKVVQMGRVTGSDSFKVGDEPCASVASCRVVSCRVCHVDLFCSARLHSAVVGCGAARWCDT